MRFWGFIDSGRQWMRLIVGAASATVCGASYGATIVQYHFDTGSGLTPSYVNSSLATASAFTGSSGVAVLTTTPAAISNNTNSYGNSAAAGQVFTSSGYTRTASIGNNGGALPVGNYVAFSVAPANNTLLDLDSVSLEAANGGASGPRGYDLYYSYDNFATGAVYAGTATTSLTQDSFFHFSWALDDQNAALDTTASTVYFRFYGFAPAAGSNVRLDNVVVTGNIAVPEPAAIGWVTLGSVTMLCGTLLRRRA